LARLECSPSFGPRSVRRERPGFAGCVRSGVSWNLRHVRPPSGTLFLVEEVLVRPRSRRCPQNCQRAVTSCAAVAEQFASSNQILVRGSDGIRHFRRFASHRGLHRGRHNSVLEPRRGKSPRISASPSRRYNIPPRISRANPAMTPRKFFMVTSKSNACLG
jgi:hypothetical protein